MAVDMESMPFFPRSTGLGPVAFAAARREEKDRIDDGQIGIELVRLTQPAEQIGVRHHSQWRTPVI